jgi:hypothetical protein
LWKGEGRTRLREEDRLSRAFLLALLVGRGREQLVRPAIDGAHLARELAGGSV